MRKDTGWRDGLSERDGLQEDEKTKPRKMREKWEGANKHKTKKEQRRATKRKKEREKIKSEWTKRSGEKKEKRGLAF